ncbi:hypothetical protein GA0115260_1018718 [Streptomyces sp. MnatMP-M27]|nr:hypothetical protein GA0115260_1018718 [Streptomyces sp. MnatMP-M27]
MEDSFAEVVQSRSGGEERLSQRLQRMINIAIAGIEQSVGVKRQQGTFRYPQFGRFEGQAADTEGWAATDVQEFCYAVRKHQDRWWVSGTCYRAHPGYGVVDYISARGSQAPTLIGVLTLLPKACQHVVEMSEKFVGRQVYVGHSADCCAQSAHRRSGIDTVPHNITYNERNAFTRQGNDIEPIASDSGQRIGGKVATRRFHCGLVPKHLWQETLLKSECSSPLTRVPASVVQADSGPRHNLLGKQSVFVGECLLLTSEQNSDAEDCFPGGNRNRHDRVPLVGTEPGGTLGILGKPIAHGLISRGMDG